MKEREKLRERDDKQDNDNKVTKNKTLGIGTIDGSEAEPRSYFLGLCS